MSAPLTSGADISVFSSKDAFGNIVVETAPLFMQLQASQSASQSKSNKTGSSGAFFFGEVFDNPVGSGSCWSGDASTDTIQFAAEFKPPRITTAITASGSVPVTWFDYCAGLATFTEDVPFSMNLSTITDQAFSEFGSLHQEFGTIRINKHFDDSFSPATANNSVITSPRFGTVTPANGYVGYSRGHSVEITK